MIRLLADDAALSLLASCPRDQREAITAHVVDDAATPSSPPRWTPPRRRSASASRAGWARCAGGWEGGVSDFVTELRREVVTRTRSTAPPAAPARRRAPPPARSSPARSRSRPARRGRARGARSPRRSRPPSRAWSRCCGSAASRPTACSRRRRCGWPTPGAPRSCGSTRHAAGDGAHPAVRERRGTRRRGGRRVGARLETERTWATAGSRASTRRRTASPPTSWPATGGASPSPPERSGSPAGNGHRWLDRLTPATGAVPAGPLCGTRSGSPSRRRRWGPSAERHGRPHSTPASGGSCPLAEARTRHRPVPRRHRSHRRRPAGVWLAEAGEGRSAPRGRHG